MKSLYGVFARPGLFALEPETAHRLTVQALRALPIPCAGRDDPRLAVEALGLAFPNPLGMAAGFDKDGEVAGALVRLGFGFVEVGTLTPRPQPGNPRPRVFRLPADGALINRLGFNNDGHLAAHGRLARQRGGIVLGINIGANRTTQDRIGDYVAGIGMFADIAGYFTINVSSPNTPGLRDLQQRAALDDLLARVLEARDGVSRRFGRKPVLVKIAPDVGPGELDDIVAVARARAIDGMIVANTTVSRPDGLIDWRRAAEQGGLSGRPLFALSTRVLAQAFQRVERQFPLVGIGGIDGPQAAYAKVRAGASLLQLYTALIYEGPGLVGAIKRGLVSALARDGYGRLADAVGTDADDWASGKLAAVSVG